MWGIGTPWDTRIICRNDDISGSILRFVEMIYAAWINGFVPLHVVVGEILKSTTINRILPRQWGLAIAFF